MIDRIPTQILENGAIRYAEYDGAGNFVQYRYLLPSDEPTQIGTPLNKGTLLSDTTAALFGLSEHAVPDGALAFLGKYNQHWWSQRAYTAASFSLGAKTSISIAVNQYVNYSDSLDISENGSVSLKAPVTQLKVSGGEVQLNAIKGKFFTTTDSYYAGNTYQRTQEDASGFVCTVYSVTGIPAKHGLPGYTYSSNRNAYPDSGVSEGYEYEYLGIPFKNSVTAPQIITGSYTGTGTSGASNPNSLTFDFLPKIVVFMGQLDTSSNRIQNYYPCVIPFAGFDAVLNGQSFYYDANNDFTVTVNPGNKSMTWYGTSVDKQWNADGLIYRYYAIG